MKKRLTVSVDADLIPSAKRYARERGVTLSSLVEESLRELASADGAPVDGERSHGSAPGRSGPEASADDESRAGEDIPEFELPPGDPPREGATSWVERWAGFLEGKLTPPTGDDPRYEYLWYKWRLYESDDSDTRSPAEQEAAREAILKRWRGDHAGAPAA